MFIYRVVKNSKPSTMLFIAWQKISAVAFAVIILAAGQITVMKTASSQTLAVFLRSELILVFEIVMIMVSRFIIWRTLVPLLRSFANSNESMNHVVPDESGKIHGSLRKSKCSEVDIKAINPPGFRQTVRLGKAVLLIYLALCHVSYLTNLFLINTDPHWLSMLSYSCFGSYIQLISGICIFKLLSLALSLCKKRDSGHSQLIQKYYPLLAVMYMIIASSFGLYTASQPPSVKHVAIPVKDLPSNLEGISIIQLSDIHLGPTVGFSKLSKIVEIVNEEKPGT